MPFSVCNLLSGNALACNGLGDFEQVGYDMTHIGNAILYISLNKDGEGLPIESPHISNFMETINLLKPVGVGLTGLAEYLFKEGLSYTDTDQIKEVYKALTRGSLVASSEWAKNTGDIAEWDPIYKEKHLAEIGYTDSNTDFYNTTTTCQAPTGTISQFLNCVSTGIEPLKSFKMKLSYFNSENKFKDVILTSKVIPEEDIELETITPEDQLKTLSAIQSIMHTSASKTINVPFETTKDEIKDIIVSSQKYKLKGLTIFRQGCKTGSVVCEIKDEKCPDIVTGKTYKFRGQSNNTFIVMNHHEGDIKQVFIETGKSGSIITGLTNGLGMVTSLALESGVDPSRIVKRLGGIDTGEFLINKRIGSAKSICDALAKAIYDFSQNNGHDISDESVAGGNYDLCPECNNLTLVRLGAGCKRCDSCGYATC